MVAAISEGDTHKDETEDSHNRLFKDEEDQTVKKETKVKTQWQFTVDYPNIISHYGIDSGPEINKVLVEEINEILREKIRKERTIPKVTDRIRRLPS